MHEMSLCEGIRGVIEDHTAGQNVQAVKRVRVEIGALAGVEKPALEFAWDVVMRGSLAEGATLELIDLPAQAMCYDCGALQTIKSRLDPCPTCGGSRLMPVSGDELRVKDMEVV